MPGTGHDHSWQLFCELDPAEACAHSGASYDHQTGVYSIRSFGQDIEITPAERKVYAESPIGSYLLEQTGHFFDLALLWYLMSPGEIPFSDELVRPSDIKGGQIFVTGTHVLPVKQIEKKFGAYPAEFLERGRLLGGDVLDHGDAAVKLQPFPMLPLTLILWEADDEFPARVDLFFHRGCDLLATDVLWSTAMVAVLAMSADL